MTLPTEMTFVDLPEHGAAEVMRLARRPLPEPGPGEILIRVAGAGINSPDLQQRRGRYDPPPGASPILGLEVAGEVASLGPGVTRFRLGDRVAALCNGGGYAEFVAVPAGQALPVPAGWSMPAAAALPETFFTIQQTLVLRAGLAAGMHVLIHGAAGGIGSAAIAIARAYDAIPIAVVSSPEKAAYAMSLGAEATIDRTEEDVVARTRELTGGRGAERIVDIVGGTTMAGNLEAAALEAVILQLATLAGGTAEINAGLIVGKRLSILGSTLRPQPPAIKAKIAASLAETVWPALGDGRLTAPRTQYFPLDQAVEAHRAMEERSHFGKIVLLTPFGAAVH